MWYWRSDHRPPMVAAVSTAKFESSREAAPRGPVAAALAACAAMATVGSSFAVLDGLRDYPAAGGQALRYAVGAALLAALARGRIGPPSKTELMRVPPPSAPRLGGV